uniref:Rieske domain-containing protein n=1 Tax=Pelusios castaneus TaxID=367368 RepID=A0A8C8RFN2_9SAUR
LQEVEVAGHKVLLVRNQLGFSAVGSKCTHAGAPLSKGVLAGNRLRCPWHGACFSVRTGDIEEYPTLDCLPCFKVPCPCYVSSIPVRQPHTQPEQTSLCPGHSSPARVLRVGVLSTAALVCAETLRQEAFTGRIIMVSQENHIPYDRTQLSKVCAWPELVLKPLTEGIEVWTGKEVRDLPVQGKWKLIWSHFSYSPRQLQCPGSNLENVCNLQTPEDAKRILQLATGRRVVVLGASFIGMEVAAFLSDRASAICIVEREEFPFQAVLGPHVGEVAMKMLQNKGVKFYMKAEISELRGENRKVSKSLTPMPLLDCSQNLGLSFLFQSGHMPFPSTGHLVSKFMQTNVPGVFAAGDVTSFPIALFSGTTATIRHWQIAQAHGHTAALNMLNKRKELHTVPFFWTSLFGKSIRYAGYGKGYTDTVVKGNLEQLKFLVFYIKDDRVIAAASLNFDPMVSVVAEAMYSGRQISKAEHPGDMVILGGEESAGSGRNFLWAEEQ